MKILENKKIFIVEDNINNLSVYSVTLKQNGGQIFQDYFNARTVDMISNAMPIDIIVMDLMLKAGRSGYDVFDILRENPEFDHIPVVAVSASDPDIEIPKARSKGFNGFIAKPISIHSFPQQIADIIDGKKMWIAG